jgi:lipopolysaccharide transport protein LptA
MMGTPSQGLSLRADRLNYLPNQGKILLVGHVTLKAGKLSLKADRVVLQLDKRTQRPQHATASGTVVLTQNNTRASASKVSLTLYGDQSSKRPPIAELEDAKVTRAGGFQVQGKRIYLDLSTGGIVVHQAKASLPGRSGAGNGR